MYVKTVPHFPSPEAFRARLRIGWSRQHASISMAINSPPTRWRSLDFIWFYQSCMPPASSTSASSTSSTVSSRSQCALGGHCRAAEGFAEPMRSPRVRFPVDARCSDEWVRWTGEGGRPPEQDLAIMDTWSFETKDSWAQCALPDFNCESLISVSTVALQVRVQCVIQNSDWQAKEMPD